MIAILFLWLLSIIGILSSHADEWVILTALVLSTTVVLVALGIIYKRSPDSE